MKLALCSDIHADFAKFGVPDEDVDLILIAGDVTNVGFDYIPPEPRVVKNFDNIPLYKEQIKEAALWLQELEKIAPTKYCIGNHDIQWGSLNLRLFQGDVMRTIKEGIGENLTDRRTEYQGLTIAGANMSPCYEMPDLALQWIGMTCNRSVEKAYYEDLPSDIDILISHCPPVGKLGITVSGVQIGSKYLREYIEKNQPKLVVCGHNHPEKDFQPEIWQEYIGDTRVVNTARCWSYVEI